VYHQTSTSSEETLKSKLAFEKFAASHGVSIKHYHADNGRFKDNIFMNSIEEKGQNISFSGMGAHHVRIYAPNMPQHKGANISRCTCLKY
jgi:hypothetical protein